MYNRRFQVKEHISYEKEESDSEKLDHSLNNSEKKNNEKAELVDPFSSNIGTEFIVKEDGFEDVKKSSTLFNQLRISEFVSLYF